MLLGMISTTLSFGCVYAMDVIPFFDRTFPTPVLIVAAVVIFFLVSFPVKPTEFGRFSALLSLALAAFARRYSVLFRRGQYVLA